MTWHDASEQVWRRQLAGALLGCALAATVPGALAQAKKPPASKEPLVFGINEGATTQVSVGELVERYTPIAKSIERTLARPMTVEVYPETARFRTELGKGRFDVIFGKTVNLLAGAVRDKQFHAVVKTKAPYIAGFITAKGSPIKKPEDLRGKIIMMPERVFTTKLAEATLRDLGLTENDVKIQYTRLQEVVAYSVETGMVDVGVVNPTVKRQWQEKGNPVLLETKPVPNWSIIASPKFSETEVERLRAMLIALKDSPQGEQALKAIGVPEFVAATNAEYIELLKYIKE
jgi:ABC-type phosphate/phosphonate transport system substrate-binding protein